MAIAIYFRPVAMSADTYDRCISLLEEQGAGSPAGRLHHSTFGQPGALGVYDVWESQEAFDAFGATLMPILDTLGIDIGQPSVMPLHSLVQ